MARRNRKLDLKSKEELYQHLLDQRTKARNRYRKKHGIKIVDNRTECQVKRGVENCEECSRCAFCKGLQTHPWTEKDIDLFLWGK